MKTVTKWFSLCVSAVLGLFSGMVGCNASEEDLYMGAPPNVGGKVLDAATDDPIAGIRVELLKGGTSIDSKTTGTNGSFYMYVGEYGATSFKQTVEVRLTDSDGAANGEYLGQTNMVAVDYSANTNFKLTKK